MKNWEEVDFVTLGCSKNLVDSESLMGLFERNGFRCTHDAKHPKAEIVVINTCGFIEDAKQESIDTILAFAQKKDEGRIKRLYVMGCLSQRYQKELEKEIPQVDKWYGKFNFKQLLTDLVNGNANGNLNYPLTSYLSIPSEARPPVAFPLTSKCTSHLFRKLTTPSH